MYNYGCMPYMQMMPMYYPMDIMDPCEQTMNMMYPKEYYKIYPLVCYYCDKMEYEKGIMCCPSEEDLKKICDEIYEKVKDEVDDEDRDDGIRQYGRRRGIRNIGRILFLRELVGRRRRRGGRRRRRKPYYGYGYPNYGYYGYDYGYW